jgi:hypothetical protein
VAVTFSLLVAGCVPAARPAVTASEGEIVAATPIADVLAPRFEPLAQQTRIERFDPPGAGALLGVAISNHLRNPNDFAITVERIEYTLTLAGTPVARGVLEPALPLAANASEPLAWRIDAPLTDHRPLWRPVVDTFAGTPLPFTLEGVIRFTSQSYAFTTGTLLLVEGTLLADRTVVAPRLRLDGKASRVTVVRSDAPVVAVSLLASNPGDIGYFLSGRELALSVNDAFVATLELGPVPVSAGETRRIELIFIIDVSRLGEEALAALGAALRGERAVVVVRGGFAYDVLGVDSYAVDVGDGLTTALPPAQLPGGSETGADGDDDD